MQSAVNTAPVGFDGLETMSSRVRGLIAAATRSGSGWKPSAAAHGTGTGVPPASRTCPS